MKFKTQYLTKEAVITYNKEIVYYLLTYRKLIDVLNLPDDDIRKINTLRIISFKNGETTYHEYFKRCIYNHLDLFTYGDWILISIPSHDQLTIDKNNMDLFLSRLNLPNNIHYVQGLLIRKEPQLPKHLGEYGERNISKDINSYKLGTTLDIRNKNIIVIDDIVTSGCSLIGAKRYLQMCGANIVITIAIGKRVYDTKDIRNDWR